VPGEELLHDEESSEASGAAGVEETLPPVQPAHAAQGNEVGMAAFITRTRDFFDEVVEELKKVTWPDVGQLKSATVVIIIFVLIVSAIIWAMDLTVSGVLDIIMSIFTS
jgi:preprotein translocase subunit SecE